MDEIVARSMAKWPNVPAVYGWLSLDRRGGWRIRGERIANPALREFIGRNYQADGRGRWYFQNGPQRVFVRLEYTPLVVRHDGEALLDHCDRPFAPVRMLVDDEGSLLMEGAGTVALLDDRDLARYADEAQALPAVARGGLAAAFGFVPEPGPE
jgi:hypothetical protein